jgi:hypothetical protein
LRRRRTADEDLSRILGSPVERWNLCELVTARALDVEVELSSAEWGQVGVFRSGPLTGSRVSIKFYSAREYLCPTGPEPPCDYHVAIKGPPDTRLPELIHRIYLFEVAGLPEEMEGRGSSMAQVDDSWDAFEIYPRSFSPWKVFHLNPPPTVAFGRRSVETPPTPGCGWEGPVCVVRRTSAVLT